MPVRVFRGGAKMKVSCFVELCAGTGALSLALQAGARPPVSRMGSKTGYTWAILSALGLRAGQGADSYLWCEPDAGMASVLRCYPDPDALRAIAERIRSWKDEEPRALWERLRAEGKAQRGEDPGAWLWIQGNATPHAPDVWKTVPKAAVACGVEANLSLDGLEERTEALSSLRFPPVRVIQGQAEEVEVGEVARWIYVVGQSVQKCGIEKTSWFTRPTGDGQKGCDGYADDIASLPSSWPPIAVYRGRSEDVEPGRLPEGVVCYMDPPYHGDGKRKITGYGHAFPRASQVEVAGRWHRAGATVCISECVSLRAEMETATGERWHDFEVTGYRVGQSRTFCAEDAKREWITCNRPLVPPNRWPARRTDPAQELLFGGAP